MSEKLGMDIRKEGSQVGFRVSLCIFLTISECVS
jgi:hypothetical protein